MSKFGWDLPPGVTTSMLPGNTPEDTASEELLEAISGAAQEDLSEEALERLAALLETRIGAAYRSGYLAGQSDEAEAERVAQEEADARKGRQR